MAEPTVAQIASGIAAQWEQAHYARLQYWAAVSQVFGSILAIGAAFLAGGLEAKWARRERKEERMRLSRLAIVPLRSLLMGIEATIPYQVDERIAS